MNDKGLMEKTIYLFKGDSSDFVGNQEVGITLDTELDLRGLRAVFTLFDNVQEFFPIPEDKMLRLSFTKFDTAKFPLGVHNGTLYLTDDAGKRRTVSDAVHFVVTNSVKEAYFNKDSQVISFVVSGGINFVQTVNGIEPAEEGALTIDVSGNVHTVNGVEPDENRNIEIDVSGKVKTVNDEGPDDNGNIKIEFPECAVQSVNGNLPDDDGNVAVDVGVKTINGEDPDANGNYDIEFPAPPTVGDGTLTVKYNDVTKTFNANQTGNEEIDLGDIQEKLPKQADNRTYDVEVQFSQYCNFSRFDLDKNEITETYATKDEVISGLSQKQDTLRLKEGTTDVYDINVVKDGDGNDIARNLKSCVRKNCTNTISSGFDFHLDGAQDDDYPSKHFLLNGSTLRFQEKEYNDPRTQVEITKDSIDLIVNHGAFETEIFADKIKTRNSFGSSTLTLPTHKDGELAIKEDCLDINGPNLVGDSFSLVGKTGQYCFDLSSGRIEFSEKDQIFGIKYGYANLGKSGLTLGNANAGYQTVFSRDGIYFSEGVNGYTFYFPTNSGTIALTSDIPNNIQIEDIAKASCVSKGIEEVVAGTQNVTNAYHYFYLGRDGKDGHRIERANIQANMTEPLLIMLPAYDATEYAEKMVTLECVLDYSAITESPEYQIYIGNDAVTEASNFHWVGEQPEFPAGKRHLLTFRYCYGEWLASKQGEW